MFDKVPNTSLNCLTKFSYLGLSCSPQIVVSLEIFQNNYNDCNFMKRSLFNKNKLYKTTKFMPTKSPIRLKLVKYKNKSSIF